MANAKKYILFDHFKPRYSYADKDGVTHDKVFDLHPLLTEVAKHPFSETKKKVAGDTHMFHVCRYDGDLHG